MMMNNETSLSICHETFEMDVMIPAFFFYLFRQFHTIQFHVGSGPSSAAPSGGATPAAAAAPVKEEKPKEEVVDALDGGMDMFGGGGGGGGDY